MNLRKFGYWLLLFSFLSQGCATTHPPKKHFAKKKNIPARHNESFALMDDFSRLDPEIMKRGNRARGLSEY